jgi:hypothetical protein
LIITQCTYVLKVSPYSMNTCNYYMSIKHKLKQKWRAWSCRVKPEHFLYNYINYYLWEASYITLCLTTTLKSRNYYSPIKQVRKLRLREMICQVYITYTEQYLAGLSDPRPTLVHSSVLLLSLEQTSLSYMWCFLNTFTCSDK